MKTNDTDAQNPPPPAWPRWLAVAGGVLLLAIGLRFWLDPETAARGFGVPRGHAGHALHQAIALRDIWLGALAVLLALLKEWRALALWLALGTVVCWGDAAIVLGAGGKWGPVAFHLGAGAVSLVLAALVWRRRLGGT